MYSVQYTTKSKTRPLPVAHSQSPTDWKAGVPSCFHQIRSCLTLFVAWNLASSNSKAPGLVLASVPVLVQYLWSLASFHRSELTASAGLLFWPTHTHILFSVPSLFASDPCCPPAPPSHPRSLLGFSFTPLVRGAIPHLGRLISRHFCSAQSSFSRLM